MSKHPKPVPACADGAAVLGGPGFGGLSAWGKAEQVRLPWAKPSTTAISIGLPVGLREKVKVAAERQDVPYRVAFLAWACGAQASPPVVAEVSGHADVAGGDSRMTPINPPGRAIVLPSPCMAISLGSG